MFLSSCLNIALCAAFVVACGDDVRPTNGGPGDAAVVLDADGSDARATDGRSSDGASNDGARIDGALGDAADGAFSDAGGNDVMPAAGPAAVNLRTAAGYVILAKAGISATVGTMLVGNIGVSPAAEDAITGFGQARSPTNEFSISPLVVGRIEASDMAVPTPSKLTTAIADTEAAFTEAAGRTLPDFTERGAGDISGLTLVPGLYKWSSGVLVASSVTLAGGPNDVWIFQISQDLTLSSGVQVTLAGGARANNIFWQVAGKVVLGTTSKMKGNILSQTQIVLETGASLEGRALAQTAVTLDANMVSAP